MIDGQSRNITYGFGQYFEYYEGDRGYWAYGFETLEDQEEQADFYFVVFYDTGEGYDVYAYIGDEAGENAAIFGVGSIPHDELFVGDIGEQLFASRSGSWSDMLESGQVLQRIEFSVGRIDDYYDDYYDGGEEDGGE